MSDSKGKRAQRESDHGRPASEAAPIAAAVTATEQEIAQMPAAPEKRTEAGSPPPRVEPPAASADAALAALGEAQLVLVRGFGEIAADWAGLTQAGVAAGADAAVALLGAKTITEAVDIQAGLARRGIDAAIAGAVRLSDIGIRTAGDAARPILSGLTRMSPPFAVP
jgi:hypothetical protein